MRPLYLFTLCLPLLLSAAAPLAGQEADDGIDVRATVSGEGIYAHQLTESPRNGTAPDGAFRAVVYPTLKVNEHWTVAGAVRFSSNPYLAEDFTAPGHAVTTRVLRANSGDPGRSASAQGNYRRRSVSLIWFPRNVAVLTVDS